jgi:hypothetical protein
MMKKKVWNTPKLVVLMRGKSEEAVLITCKTRPGLFFVGPEGEDACINIEGEWPCNQWFQT